MPSGLNKEQQAAWRKVVKQVGGLGLLSATDTHALLRIAIWRVIYAQALRSISKRGGYEVTAYDRNGKKAGKRTAPAVARLKQADEALTKLEARFGLTPSDRASIGIAISTAKTASDNESAMFGDSSEVG
jgi:P27 family predicted phage terminase small subunit